MIFCLFVCFWMYCMVVGDYKEGYYIGVEVPEDDPEADKPFYGPNVWPADGIFFFFFFFIHEKIFLLWKR